MVKANVRFLEVLRTLQILVLERLPLVEGKELAGSQEGVPADVAIDNELAVADRTSQDCQA